MTELVRICMLQLKQLQVFLWLNVTTAILGVVVCLVLCRKLRWNSRRMKFLALFSNLENHVILGLSVAYIKFMLVLSVTVTGGAAVLSHYVILVLCTVLFVTACLDMEKGVMVVVSNLLMMAAMGVSSLLRQYIIQVNPETSYFIVLICLNICIAAYDIYLGLTEVQLMMEEKRSAYEESQDEGAIEGES